MFEIWILWQFLLSPQGGG
jgi:hypothetical protein